MSSAGIQHSGVQNTHHSFIGWGIGHATAARDALRGGPGLAAIVGTLRALGPAQAPVAELGCAVLRAVASGVGGLHRSTCAVFWSHGFRTFKSTILQTHPVLSAT